MMSDILCEASVALSHDDIRTEGEEQPPMFDKVRSHP